MKITVMKFGGTSVQDAEAISRLVQIVNRKKDGRLVVVSALAGVTNSLVKVVALWKSENKIEANSILNELLSRHSKIASDLGQPDINEIEILFKQAKDTIGKPYQLALTDSLYALGELASSHLVTKAFANAARVDARELIITTSDYNNAAVDFQVTNKNIISNLHSLLSTKIVVTQGFIGSNGKGDTTTLGRGGSDYSASVFGAALMADSVEIWTDVDGILSTDPRIVKDAVVIPKLHFQEAAEMAYFGAKVLHPDTIYPALDRKIPVYILNSKNPESPGTLITFDDSQKSTTICGIAFKRNITLVNIYSTRMLRAHGFLNSLFAVFAQYKLSVDLIATSEVNVSLTLDPNSDLKALEAAKAELSKFSQIEVHFQRAMISVIGGGLRRQSGIGAKIFNELIDTNVQMISMGASELNISFVVNNDQCEEVVKRLHRKLISSAP